MRLGQRRALDRKSEIRVGAKILPYLIAGSDLICSGFGSILKYDNSFNPSLLNGEELEDFLVLQRDFEADGGLTPMAEERALDLRRRALDAISAVFEELGLGEPTAAMKESVRRRLRLERHGELSPGDVGAHLRGDQGARHHRHRRHQGARQARLPRRGGEPALAGQAAALGRLSADLGDGPRRPGPVRRQRSERLSGPGNRLPRLGGAPPRDQRHPRRARPRDRPHRRNPSSPATSRR